MASKIIKKAKKIIDESTKETNESSKVPEPEPKAEANQKTEAPKEKVKPSSIDNLEITNEKDSDRSRFSHIKHLKQGGQDVAELYYEKENNGDIEISHVGTYPESNQRKGFASKLLKNLIEENPDSKITISPMLPDGANLFSKLLGRKLEPSLGEGAESLKNVKPTRTELNEKDILNLKKNLGISTSAKIQLKPSKLEVKKSKSIRDLAKNILKEKNKKKTKKAKKEKVPEPIVETTGKDAYQQMEPEPTLMGKIKDTAKGVVEGAKDPKQLRANINKGLHDALNPIRLHEKDIPVHERVTTKIHQAQRAASDINNILEQGVFDNILNQYTSRSLKSAYVENGEVWKKLTKGLKDHEYSTEDINAYRGSKEALKRQRKGLKSGIDTQLAIQTVAKLKQKYGPIDQRIHEYQKGVANSYAQDTLTPEAREQ